MEETKLTELDLARIEVFAGCTIFSPNEVKNWLQWYISGWRYKDKNELVGMMQAIQAEGYSDLISGYIKMKPEFEKLTYSQLKARLLVLEYTLQQIGRIAENKAEAEHEGYYLIETMVKEVIGEGGNK